MARVTVEDCILEVPNRFDLVTLAAQRAKQIAAGNPITVDRDNDKDPVVALREIADKTINIEQLREERVQHFCKRHAAEGSESGEDSGSTGEDKRAAEIQESFEETKQAAALGTKPAKLPGDMSFAEENIEVED